MLVYPLNGIKLDFLQGFSCTSASASWDLAHRHTCLCSQTSRCRLGEMILVSLGFRHLGLPLSRNETTKGMGTMAMNGDESLAFPQDPALRGDWLSAGPAVPPGAKHEFWSLGWL